MKRLSSLTVFVLVFLPAFSPLASTQLVIFSDSFDRVEGFNDDPDNMANFSDWGMNDNEFGGTVVQTYSMDTSRPGGAQSNTDGEVGIIRNGAVQINADFSALAPNGYTVEFDFTRRSGVGFVTLGIGLDPTVIPSSMGFNSNAFVFDQDATVDGAVLFQQDNDNPGNGRVQVFNAANSILAVPNAFFDDESTHTASISVVAENGYENGAMADVFVLVDGNAPIASTVTFDGENSGYLALYSNQTGAMIDNLLITAIDFSPRSCDFNSDGSCDLADLDDLLTTGQSNQAARFDLDGDGTVDLADRDALLIQIERPDGQVGSLPGDANLSGITDAADLNIVGINWQQNASSYAEGDFNGDGFVDAADLNDLGINWLKTSDQFAMSNAQERVVAFVPEPGAFGAGLLSILSLFVRQRRSPLLAKHGQGLEK